MRQLMATLLFFLALASANAEDNLPVPGYDAGRDVPDALLAPDPNTVYKVMFDFAMNDDNLDDPYPMLPLVATYVNTLAKFGVPPEHRKIAIILHRGSGLIGLNNDKFKELNDGKDNPNLDLIRKLRAAGVTFHQCGQGVVARNLEADDYIDEIQIDYWALTTLIELGRQGYVKIGG